MRTLSHNSKLYTSLALITFGSFACLAEPRQEIKLEAPKPIENSPALPAGTYDVQTVSYDDGTGSYHIFLLGTPEGTKPLFQHTDVQMARLTDEAITAGKKTHLEFPAEGSPILHLTPEFQIAYTHNVTEEHVDPATQQRETVIVGQQTSSWSPFMAGMTGAMIGNMLFSPRYYYPPPFAASGMAGVGGMGETRALASQSYAQKFGNEPNAVRHTKTGMAPRRVAADSLRSSGRGAGSSRLKPSAPSTPRRRPSFGGGGFGRRRR